MMNLLITCMKTNDEEIIENGVTRMKHTTEHRVQARTLVNALNIASACCMGGFRVYNGMVQNSFSIRSAETDALIADGEFHRIPSSTSDEYGYWDVVMHENDGSVNTIYIDGEHKFSFFPM